MASSSTVETMTTLESQDLIICLGGNVGNIRETLAIAVERIGESVGEVRAQSLLYRSEPWGFASESWFLNQVVHCRTSLEPEDALTELQRIEKDLGRIRSGEAGYVDRPVDLDILLHGDRVWESERLQIPHPRLAERRFVLLPLQELFPDLVIPVWNATPEALLQFCQDPGQVELAENNSPDTDV